MTDELREILAEALEVEEDEIESGKYLKDYENWDSVTALTLTVALSDLAGAPILPNEMKALEKISDIEALIAAKKA